MRKPNVLFLAEELRMGGAETYFYELENGISSDVNFYSMAVPGDGKARLDNPLRCEAYSFNFLDRIKRIGDYARQVSADVIHCNSLQLAFCASAACRISKWDCKIAYTKHNLTKLEKFNKKIFVYFVNHYIDRLIAICPTDSRNLIKDGVNPAIIKVINNGVDMNKFAFCPHQTRESSIGSDEFEIGILARLSPEKNHEKFLLIAREILKQHPNVCFSIAGDGPERDSISKLIDSMGLSENISMLGMVDPVEYLKTIDCLMLVSSREVMPMSIVEGMATGVLVIARDVGGVSDIVKQEFSFLIEGDDESLYVDAFESAIRSDIFTMLTRARRYAETEFSLERSLSMHKELYYELGCN